ncbi:hypothetical protein BDR26DRAFT_822822, partial [Obelidium mucronatum]
MSDEKLPFLIDLETTSSQEEINVLRTEYKKQVAAGKVNPQTKFDYAYNLVKSGLRKDHEAGLQLLHELYKDNPARRRECLFYLSVGHFKLASFVEARKFADILLQMEPRNAQTLALRAAIDARVRRDGLVGLALVGGAVACAAAFFAFV